MKMTKLLVLPVFLITSLAFAERGLLTVSVNDKHLTAEVDYSDALQESVNEAGNLKTAFHKADDLFIIEVSVKNEEGEWELLKTLEVSAVDGTEVSKGTVLPSVDGIITLQTIK